MSVPTVEPAQRRGGTGSGRPAGPRRRPASPRRALLVASLRMFYRNKHSIFWTLLLPVVILAVFALLNLGGGTTAQLGVVDNANTATSAALVNALQRSDLVSVHAGLLADEESSLHSGDRDAVLVIQPDYDGAGGHLTLELNGARSKEAESAQLVVGNAVDAQARTHGAPQRTVSVAATTVNNARNQGYTDFLIPGIIALSVMQTGLFTVLYTFVHLRQRGILRRLKATPLRATDFLAAQVGTRLILAAAQTLILVLIALLVFRIHIYGNVGWLLLVAVLGAAVFLALGFAISGSTGSVESAAPIANLIGLPMIVLSGVFFSRGGMPGWLHGITDLLPLTYLVDALRHVSYDGFGLLDIRGDIAGMLVWLAISGVLAVRLFRWELD